MKTDIIIAGVGGQGILSIAAILGSAAINNNLYIKQAETHGMSQRGGDVQSHARLSDRPVFSDLIAKGTADLILSVEPMEALRYLPFLSPDGYLVANSAPLLNIPDYPPVEDLISTIQALPRRLLVDADAIARESTGSSRPLNVVMLGAASPFIDLPFAYLERGLINVFERKGADIAEMNLKALRAGRAFAIDNVAGGIIKGVIQD